MLNCVNIKIPIKIKIKCMYNTYILFYIHTYIQCKEHSIRSQPKNKQKKTKIGADI